MKVGEYIRTKQGIEKIKVVEENFMGDENCIFYATDNKEWNGAYNGKYNGFTNRNRTIIKSSPNIIDLIELGDLVRLFMEEDVDKEDTDIFEVVAINDNKKEIGVFTGNFEIEFFPVENLRGIVTHEQFLQMEYRIGE